MYYQRSKTNQLGKMAQHLHDVILENTRLEEENEHLKLQSPKSSFLQSPEGRLRSMPSMDSDQELMHITKRLLNQNETLDQIVHKQKDQIELLKNENRDLIRKQALLVDEVNFLKQNQERRLQYLEKKLMEAMQQNDSLSKLIN